MKILILGSTGMIGHTFFSYLSKINDFEVCSTQRKINSNKKLFYFDALNFDGLHDILNIFLPDVVINCIGITKHSKDIKDRYKTIMINSLLPWKLKNLSDIYNFRFIHISTDCVFNGRKGNYLETDINDENDFYGKSKSLGEISDVTNCVTVRTSTIGHEKINKYGLLEWFLSQTSCKGFTKAIFSGLPTIVLIQIIKEHILMNKNLFGLFHIGAIPIAKYDLLKLINHVYERKINIIADDTIEINRSLNSDKFKSITDFKVPSWPELIKIMKENK